VLAVFQQTFLSPMYLFAAETAKNGKIGDIKQVSIAYNGFSRRWDWQTLQKKVAGSAYNTGPHPIGIAMGLMDFDPNIRVAYSKLDTVLTSGDADDFVKIILDAPGKPLADIEMHSNDAYGPWTIKLLGTLGTMRCNGARYEMTYIIPGENPEQPVQEKFLEDSNHNPKYCSEKLIKHTEEGEFNGNAFNVGTASLYEQLYFAITEGRPMTVTPEMAARIIGVIETVHAQNPLPVKFL
jgi:predicted dehydrogenase